MMRAQYRQDQVICWRDERGTWRHGEILDVDRDSVRTEDRSTGEVFDVRRENGRVEALREPELQSNTPPRSGRARVLMHAVAEVVEQRDVSWEDVGVLWRGDDPVIVFSPDVDDERIDAIRSAAADRTPDDIDPTASVCRAITL